MENGHRSNHTGYRAALIACGQGREWEKALRLLGDMKENNCVLDRVGHSAAIAACATGGRWAEILRLLGERVDAPGSSFEQAVRGLGYPAQATDRSTTFDSAGYLAGDNAGYLPSEDDKSVHDVWRRFDAWRSEERDECQELEKDGQAEERLADCVDAWRRAMDLIGRAGFCSFARSRYASSHAAEPESFRHAATMRSELRELDESAPDFIGISADVERHGKAGHWEHAMRLLSDLAHEAAPRDTRKVDSDSRSIDPERSGQARPTMEAVVSCGNSWARALALLEDIRCSTEEALNQSLGEISAPTPEG